MMALVEVAIVVTALRMNVERDAARGFVGARPTEVIWTLAPALLIVGVTYLSFNGDR